MPFKDKIGAARDRSRPIYSVPVPINVRRCRLLAHFDKPAVLIEAGRFNFCNQAADGLYL